MKLENTKVLFVEDDKNLRDAMKNILQDEVAEVFFAKDGQEAYEIYKKVKPEILLVDINLPYLNGLELARKIREYDHATKIIMLTAQSDIDTILYATELKLTKYLIKPFNGKALFDALDMAVSELNKFNIAAKERLVINENLIWCFENKVLLEDSKEIPLTPKEKEILNLLLANLETIMSYDNIILYVWDEFKQDTINSLKMMVTNIRKKLPVDIIKTVYGIGYKASLKGI